MESKVKKYPAKVAKLLVDNAIVYGMPVPNVEKMYECATVTASNMFGAPDFLKANNNKAGLARYYTVRRNIFLAGLKKYSAKMAEIAKLEIREILTRNRERLIAERTIPGTTDKKCQTSQTSLM